MLLCAFREKWNSRQLRAHVDLVMTAVNGKLKATAQDVATARDVSNLTDS